MYGLNPVFFWFGSDAYTLFINIYLVTAILPLQIYIYYTSESWLRTKKSV
jgi:hypothetical protein